MAGQRDGHVFLRSPLAVSSYPSPTSEASSGEGRRTLVSRGGVCKHHCDRERFKPWPPPNRRFAPATLPTLTRGRDQELASIHRAAAGFLQKLVDQRLADAGGDVLVNRHYRLA